jgi:coenzyme F420-reducing hydrogenase gamma subunit
MARAEATRPLRVGVVKFASCDGCQLALLGFGSALLEIAQRFAIVEFGEASSSRAPDGPFDILLVEGSISTPDQARHIRHLRERTTLLVTIGACATAGGIQALRAWAASDGGIAGVAAAVYPRPEEIETLATATPVADHVTVDAELRGCPIDGGQLLELLTAVSVGRRPQIPNEAVCVACKRAGRVCVMVASGEPCLGPLIHTGCGALCPGYARGCYGCFGPRESANAVSLADWFGQELGLDDGQVSAKLAGFTAWAPEFRDVISSRGGPPGFPVPLPVVAAAAEEPAVEPVLDTVVSARHATAEGDPEGIHGSGA